LKQSIPAQPLIADDGLMAVYTRNRCLHVGGGENGVRSLLKENLKAEWEARRGNLSLAPGGNHTSVLKQQYLEALVGLRGENALLPESFDVPTDWKALASIDSIIQDFVDHMITSPVGLSSMEQEQLRKLVADQRARDFIDKTMALYTSTLLRLLREKSTNEVAIAFRVWREAELYGPAVLAHQRGVAGGLYQRLAAIMGSKKDGCEYPILSIGIHTALSVAEKDILFRAFCMRLPGNAEGAVQLPDFSTIDLGKLERAKVYDVTGWALGHSAATQRLAKMEPAIRIVFDEFASSNRTTYAEAEAAKLPLDAVRKREKRRDAASVTDSTYVSEALFKWGVLVEWACLSTINLCNVVEQGNSSFLTRVKDAILASDVIAAAIGAAAKLGPNTVPLKGIHKIMLNTFMNMRGRDAWKSIVEKGQQQAMASKRQGNKKRSSGCPVLREGSGQEGRTRVMVKQAKGESKKAKLNN
jgi:hypothetical protein